MSRGTRDTNLASDREAENTSNRKTSEHTYGFTATGAAREKSSRKRRLEGDSESEISEKRDDEYANFQRFLVVPEYEEFKWDLPENLTEYTNDHIRKLISKKGLQKSIIVENPVPFNLQLPRKMNEFMKDLMFKNRADSLEIEAD